MDREYALEMELLRGIDAVRDVLAAFRKLPTPKAGTDGEAYYHLALEMVALEMWADRAPDRTSRYQY